MKGLQEPLIRTNTESSFSMENPNRPSLEVGRGHNSLTSNKDGNIRYRRTSALKSSRLDTGKMMAGRLYAVNAPKIFLETITARTSLIIIVVTYAVFLIGFSIDIWTTYQGFTDSNYVLSAYTCTKAVLNGGGTWGCSHAYQWNSTVTQLTNVLSVKLSVQQTNVTYLFSNSNISSSFDIDYNVNLWACYDAGGCGKSFKNDDTYTDNPNVWQKVLFLDNQKIKVNQNSDYSSENGGTISSLLISNTFQNQEAIPTNGLVKSYFMNVQYTNDPYNLYSGVNQDALPYLTYNFDVLTRPQQPGQDALTIVLLVFTVALLAFYLYIILPQKKILSEQKWLISYFLLLIMFQNPVYCVIVWFNPAAKPGAAYASYFLSDLSQAGLFVLWLLFADTVHRKTRKWWVFYGPKVAIGFFIFLSSLIILTFQFPGVSTTNRRDALEAVANWSTSYQVEFIVFTIMFLALIWIWTFAWCVRLYLTAKQLKRLPYMTTRYIQLSYRFFSLQATLVTIYYVFQYAFVIYFISYRVGNNYDATSFTDNINTLFRQQTQLFGKTLFLTVYATILCFLFLPSNLLDNSPIKTALAATYVITEEEHRKLIKLRKEVFHNMKKNFLHQVTLMNQIVNAKVDVFCVDIGLKMRNCSFQVYYDLPEINTESGYEGASADLDSIGYELIKHFYIEQHEIICYILREKVKLRIVVVFRGTASKRQMEDNLKYKKVKFNLDPTGLLAVDQYDGLNFKETDDTRFELESVSDDETDDIELEDEREQGFARSLSDSLNHPSKAAESLFQPSMADGGYSARTANFRETMANRVDTVRETVSKAFTGAVDVTGQGINVVVGATTDLMTTAASKTPGLKDLVGPHVHLGFYTAYLSVRPFIHEVLRTELKKFPTTVFFTGHSLGGALATLAALDVSLNTIPRVNAYLKHQEKLKLAQQFRETGGKMSLFQYYNRSHSETDTKPQLETLERASSSDSYNRSSSLKNRSSKGKSQPVFVKKIKVMMYNFGSPRVGNYGFKQLYDRVVPSSFRVVVDGDVVPGLPPTGYDHIGTEILVDSLGAGSVIIDPSFVERWLRTQTKSSVTVHSLIYYQKGLLGLKYAAEYIKKYAKEIEGEQFDPVQLVIQLRNEHKIEQLVEGHEDLVGTLAKGEETSSKSMADSVTSETRPSIVEEPQKIQKQRPDSNESIDSVVVSQQRQQALNEVHYKRDERNMQELMSQIHGIQKNDPIEWLKKNTVQRFRRARSSNEGHKSTEKDVENQIHRARSESSVIEE